MTEETDDRVTDDTGATEEIRVRAYDPDRDAEALWDLKRAFELGLGSGTGSDDKQATYEEKLTDEYAERYLDWVFWCAKHDRRCLMVAEADVESDPATESDDVTASDPDAGDESGTKLEAESGDATELAGYVFVLPQQLAMIWDAAVLNEIYVRPEYRGTGVADDLMDAAVAFAEEQDLPLDRLVLDVDRENDRAQSFYDRHGFEHWGEMVARKLD